MGLNGVGTKAVNALSSHFVVRSYRDGRCAEVLFERGELKKQKKSRAPNEPDGTYVEFLPDQDIFDEYDFNHEFVERRLWNYACLNRGLRLYFNRQKFESKKGLLDLLNSEAGDSVLYPPAYHKGQYLEFAFTHVDSYGESHRSFVNGQYTADGGTHQSAFREGVLKGVNEFYKKSFNGVDVRDGAFGVVAVKVKEPVFESQTKNKLGNTDIRGWIVNETREAIVDFLHKNRETAQKLEARITYNEKLRKELNAVKKEAKEAARRIEIKIPQLKDCKYHKGDKKRGEESTIFLAEGQSAAGSIVSSRDPETQAIFTLRGMPQNLFGKTRASIYKNEELYNMMMALGIEEDIGNLRYNQVVMATDADVDGFHIRNILMTFFLTYFEDLVTSGHVYILETPLFRVRNRQETYYCYDERDRQRAEKKLKGSAEITRFKGLGEISPKEFGQFINGDMRLVKVGVRSLATVPETLSFYNGQEHPQPPRLHYGAPSLMAYIDSLYDNYFLEYASYSIRDRAIPHIDDGLKPVQRRILHALHKIDDGKFHKVANVVGQTMQYHPHGDQSIYGALIVLANKDLFIEKQGNFGNIYTGDEAAAARYIECRLTPLAKQVLFNKALTDYVDSYDGRNQEPVVFPAKIPVLLAQGAEGIAVGMATKILPHNLS